MQYLGCGFMPAKVGTHNVARNLIIQIEGCPITEAFFKRKFQSVI